MSVAKSYASALFLAGQEEGVDPAGMDRIESQLSLFAGTLKSHPTLASVLCGPVASGAEKAAVVQQLGSQEGWHPLLQKFLVLVARKGRMALLSDLSARFARVRIESAGGVQGLLESAEPLSDEGVEQLVEAFSKKLGRPVAFERKTNADLLAGVKVTVSGTTYDGTLRAQLNRLRTKFFETSSSTH